jgi:hypothetical protein
VEARYGDEETSSPEMTAMGDMVRASGGRDAWTYVVLDLFISSTVKGL